MVLEIERTTIVYIKTKDMLPEVLPVSSVLSKEGDALYYGVVRAPELEVDSAILQEFKLGIKLHVGLVIWSTLVPLAGGKIHSLHCIVSKKP